MGGIISLLQSAFTAVASIFGYVSKRQELKNAPEVVAAKKGQNEVNEDNRIEKDVEAGDIAAVRRDIAE